jgi:competence protein ComFA
VDRKGEFNGGRVVFFLNQQTSAIRMACQEIKEMNKLAKRWRTNAL